MSPAATTATQVALLPARLGSVSPPPADSPALRTLLEKAETLGRGMLGAALP